MPHKDSSGDRVIGLQPPSSGDPLPRIALYLGAGASHFAGYRTFADFPVLIFDTKVRQAAGLPSLPPNAEKLLLAIKDSLETTGGWTTHDRFLWRLNEYQQLLMLNQVDPALQPFLRDATRLYDLHICTMEAVNVMATTTVRHYSANSVVAARDQSSLVYAKMRRVYQLYSALAALNGASPYLPIFTTNYDMLIEDLFTEFGDSNDNRLFVNGMRYSNQEGAKWTSKLYRASLTQPGWNLFRLHGCACWFYHSQGDDGIYFHRQDAALHSVRDLCAMYPGLERERGAGPHGHSFRMLYRTFQCCDLIVFIGFSFRDDDVMHTLLKVLAERRGELKILVIDSTYTIHDVRGRLEQAARRCTFPVDVPNDREISAVKLEFGSTDDFEARIQYACAKLLGKERKHVQTG